MKQLKRITAVMAAILIAVNIIVINVSAVMAAPVAAEKLAEFLAALLLAAGHSQSEIVGMDVTQMQSTVVDDLNSGKITTDTIVIDPVSGFHITVLEYMSNPENKAARDILSTAVDNFIDDILNPSDNSHGGANTGGGGSAGTRDEAVSNYFVPTLTTDLMGYGAKIERYNGNTGGKSFSYTCDYVIIDEFGICHLYGNVKEYNYDGTFYQNCRDGVSWDFVHTVDFYKFYGDVRYADGTEYPTDDTYEYQLGETADGTKVTVDMLNPDGTVTIDGVTYYPADYIKPNNLTEEGKKQLVNNITNVINNTYVISDDKPVVDAGSIDVSLPAELEDFKVSPSIITVFPFCLPFDFVRGMKTLVQKPKVPVFKTELDLTNFCGYDFGKYIIEISLEKWEPAAVIFRWFSLLLFNYTLILLSGKIVKGAGS